jgi:hypothetical protein
MYLFICLFIDTFIYGAKCTNVVKNHPTQRQLLKLSMQRFKAQKSSSSSSMALQPGVGQSLLLLGFHPEGFLVGKCAFCSE